MKRRDWWIGIALVVAAIVLHALVPRYEWRNYGSVPIVRIDRWTGRAVIGSFPGGHWTAPSEPLAIVKPAADVATPSVWRDADTLLATPPARPVTPPPPVRH